MIKSFERTFEMVDTHGLPLDVVIQHVSQNGMACNLNKFIEDALYSGWKLDKTIAVVNEAVNMLRDQRTYFYL